VAALSLNPALEDVSFCPRCGASAAVDYPRSLGCTSCGYMAFFNPKPVAGAVPVTPTGELILMRRGTPPSKGRWTFPGGFVDLGESVEEAARREAREEIGIDLEVDGLIGVYSRPEERIILIVFRARALGEPRTSDEASAVRTFAASEIPWHELAFWSTTEALRTLVDGA
jgi:ADP-ribose pyrophosphatase YjhB (NUDIX family)